MNSFSFYKSFFVFWVMNKYIFTITYLKNIGGHRINLVVPVQPYSLSPIPLFQSNPHGQLQVSVYRFIVCNFFHMKTKQFICHNLQESFLDPQNKLSFSCTIIAPVPSSILDLNITYNFIYLLICLSL